jgi:hypothetical protein
MSREQRRAYVQDLLAPLWTSEDQLAELVDIRAAPVAPESTDEHKKVR